MAAIVYDPARMRTLGRRNVLILLVAGAVALLTFLGRRTLTEHEVFAAEPAREMVAGKGLVLQPFAGEYRTKKPPGQSWLIAAALVVTRTHSEFVARLPSALCGIGFALTTAAMAARLGTRRLGLIAGLMTLTCVGVQRNGRLAEADMALALAVALANAAILLPLPLREGAGKGVRASNVARRPEPPTPPSPSRGEGDEPHRLRAFGFWTALVAGFLIKGPIVFGFTLLPAVVYVAVLRFVLDERPLATATRRILFWPPALLLGVALIVAWPVAALHTYPGAYAQWKHELLDRVSGDLGHGDEHRRDPLAAYVWILPYVALPWTLFALPGAVLLWRARGRWDPRAVLPACWLGCGFVVVSVIAFKAPHYVLPVVPPVMLGAAYGFDRILQAWLRRRPVRRRATWERVALGVWFLTAVGGWAASYGVPDGTPDPGLAARDFARRVNDAMPSGRTVYLFEIGEDRAAWYLDVPLKQTTTLPPGRPLYLICRADAYGRLASHGGVRVLARASPFVARDPPTEIRLLVELGKAKDEQPTGESP